MIFETHAHYDDKMFDEDRESLLESMQEAGIGRIVNIGADLASTASSIALSEKYPFIYAAVGWHPENLKGILRLSAAAGRVGATSEGSGNW